MLKANENFAGIKEQYLFVDIASRIERYRQRHPDAEIMRLGIGDVTRPLTPAVTAALHKASDEMGDAGTFRGYGPEQGYAFLREAVAADYAAAGVQVSPGEICIGDGAKSDLGNFGDLFDSGCSVAVCDPVYPVYADSNIIGGRSVRYLKCVSEDGFKPPLPDFDADIIYLCSPNNPTGASMTAGQLGEFVDYALEHKSLLIFDSAYEAFIHSENVPHSIYEIPGAKRCAVEFRSFSKTAGFTGLRCGYTVIPDELKVTVGGGETKLSKLWVRRQTTRFNGVAYVVQRAAEASLSPQGKAECAANVEYYMRNAAVIREKLSQAGARCWGGVDAPYIFMECPAGMDSWSFFDLLLEKAQVVGTPGAGFGAAGEGFFRLTAFNSREVTEKAAEAIKRTLLSL